MKSLLISGSYFPPQVGGISRYMASVAQYLGKDEVCCFTGVPAAAEGSSGAKEIEQETGIRVYRRPRAFEQTRIIQWAALGMSLSEILMRERPRVIQLGTADEGYIALKLHAQTNIPYLVFAHGNEILDATTSTWDKPRLSLRRAARVLANSRFTAGLVEKAGVEKKRIVVLHPGCDVNLYRPTSASKEFRELILQGHSGKQVILSVGNLVRRKGHDMVIKALPTVLREMADAVYVIAGKGPYRSELENLAVQAGVSDKVIFAGYVGDDQLPQLYSLADVFVLPSRMYAEACDVEGFGMVFLEASACKKPVIGGDSGGIPDAIVEGETGFLVDPLEAGQIADSITRVLKSPELGRKLGEEGRRRALREFTWEQLTGQLRQILNDVVGETRS